MNTKFTMTFDGSTKTFFCDEPEICPQCKHAIKPQVLSYMPYYNNEGQVFLCATYLCKNCYQPFLAFHRCTSSRERGGYTSNLVYVDPTRFEKKSFQPCIASLSPDFVEIYNQALAAESSSLNQISGVGYRKALEFLIKDYLIHLNPEETETIKRMELGNCIANKVSNDRIKAVASRSAWIGNDQTHYVQRFEDRDVQDMKNFIDACVYWISMELITEDALSMEKKDR